MRISDWSSDVCSSDLTHVGWPASPFEGTAGKRLPRAVDAAREAIARRCEVDRDTASLDHRDIARGGEAGGEPVGLAAHMLLLARNGEHDRRRGEREDREHDHQFDEREAVRPRALNRSEEHTSELQSPMAT